MINISADRIEKAIKLIMSKEKESIDLKALEISQRIILMIIKILQVNIMMLYQTYLKSNLKFH